MIGDPLNDEPVLQQAARGYRSTLITQVVRLLCKVVSVVVISRLVAPAELGLFAMASSVFALLALFRDGGLGTAAVQTRDLSSIQLHTLFWTHLVLGCLLAIAAIIAAPMAAQIYRSPEVEALLVAMSTAFILIGAGGFMRSQLQRNLRFDQLNRLETIAALSGTFLMVVAGTVGAGAYAFVVFLLVSEGVATVWAWKAHPWRPSTGPHWSSLRGLFRTGRNVTIHQIISYLLQQLDTIAIGRWFGAYPLGLYNRASQLIALPSVYVAAPLGQVMLAALSRLSPQSPEFNRHAWSTATAIAHLILPPFAICIVLPNETVRIVFGVQWLEAAPFIQLLAIGGVGVALTSLGYSITVAFGRADRLIGSSAMALPFTALAIWGGARYGVIGIAGGVALANLALTLPRVWWMLRDIPGGMASFRHSLRGPLLTMIVSMSGAWISKSFTTGTPWPVPFLVAIVSGVAAAFVTGLIIPSLRREWSAVLKLLPSRMSFSA